MLKVSTEKKRRKKKKTVGSSKSNKLRLVVDYLITRVISTHKIHERTELRRENQRGKHEQRTGESSGETDLHEEKRRFGPCGDTQTLNQL